MKEEIFGPIIPIITWSDLDEVFSYVKNFGHPLACYLFSESKSAAGANNPSHPVWRSNYQRCCNSPCQQPYGLWSFGDSGMGAYHGKQGFDCFTHYKSTLKKSTKIEIPVRVPPFTQSEEHYFKTNDAIRKCSYQTSRHRKKRGLHNANPRSYH